MTELSGTLDGVGLPPILRFLGGLKKSGALRLTHHEWYGDVFFADGLVTGASLGSHTGLAALDALVEALPGAHFDFDSQAGESGEPSIRLSPEALQIHLDDLSRRLKSGLRKFPPIDAVPSLVVQDETSEAGEEPLPLDRGTLQTLVGVDGLRSVREIVGLRGTFDALWQLASLVEVGLIEIHEREQDSHQSEWAVEVEDPTEPLARKVEPLPPTFVPPLLPLESLVVVTAHCPKLGFEDDPTNSFARPTRLHRCFATGTPMPLSLDQQRELCLSSQFGTCPRLNVSPTDDAAEDDPRIVRLPFVSRAASAQRDAVAGGGVMHEPTRLRAANGAARDDPVHRPTPLRARLERAAATAGPKGASAVADPPPASGVEALRNPRPAEAREQPAHKATALVEPAERRFVGIPIGAIVGLLVALAVIATIAYLLLPQMDSLFADDSIDTAALPNSSLVASGTPVSVVTGKANPTAAVPPATGAAAAQSEAQATPAARPNQVAAQPTVAPLQPTAAPAPANAMFLDEHFQNNDAGWPSTSPGPATVINGTYRLATRLPGQFAAIGAPIVGLPADVSVSAGFRKIGGPAGGGYGIIVRDQGPGPRDGASQEGHYYVLEIGDKGEIGIWRRDTDHWVDLQSWQHSDAVKPGNASNDLSVKAVGDTLSMIVNGTQLATKTDTALSGGTVGLFVGGDGNQVLVDHFTVQTP